MNTFDYSDWLYPTLVLLCNLFFACLLHRAIVFNSDLVRRRQYFEAMTLIGFGAALAISITGVFIWQRHSLFVLIMSLLWALFCSFVVAVLWRQHRRRTATYELEIPDLWGRVPVNACREQSPSSRLVWPYDDVGESAVAVTATDSGNADRRDATLYDETHSARRLLDEPLVDSRYKTDRSALVTPMFSANVVTLKKQRNRLKEANIVYRIAPAGRNRSRSSNLSVYRGGKDEGNSPLTRRPRMHRLGDG